jgi:hypothetical protein
MVRFWRLEGQGQGIATVPQVQVPRVELHDVTSTKGAAEHRLTCMIAAHSAVSRRLNDMQCPKNPVLVADLFDTITAGAGSYGCEIWSTPFPAGWHLRDCTLQTEVSGRLLCTSKL